MNIYFLKTKRVAGWTWNAMFDQVVIAENELAARQLCVHGDECREADILVDAQGRIGTDEAQDEGFDWATAKNKLGHTEQNIWLNPELTTCELLGKAEEGQQPRYITGDWRSE